MTHVEFIKRSMNVGCHSWEEFCGKDEASFNIMGRLGKTRMCCSGTEGAPPKAL